MPCCICARDCKAFTTNLGKHEELNHERKWNGVFLAPLAILALLLFIALGGEIVLQLWNWLLPPLFGCGRLLLASTRNSGAVPVFSSADFLEGTVPIAPIFAVECAIEWPIRGST